MKALIQRVAEARVIVDNRVVGEIEKGMLLFLGVERQDTARDVERLLGKVIAYRIFSDRKGQMNLSLEDTQGGLLIVSQFTLAANTKKGLRPSFSAAASPERAEALYNEFITAASGRCPNAQAGVFGADMKVHLVNDGPVTFMLSST